MGEALYFRKARGIRLLGSTPCCTDTHANSKASRHQTSKHNRSQRLVVVSAWTPTASLEWSSIVAVLQVPLRQSLDTVERTSLEGSKYGHCEEQQRGEVEGVEGLGVREEVRMERCW